MRRIERDFRRSAVNIPEDLSFGLVFLILGALIGLGACGSGHSNSTDNGADQTRTVTGTEVVSYLTETGTVDIPDDLSKSTITAYVPKTSGGYDALPGSGTSDGHFVIPNVAAGYYLLQIGSSYFWTSATNIDTGSQVQGRPNPAQSTNYEYLKLNIGLSVPIEPYDGYELMDLNTSTVWSAPLSGSGNTITQLFPILPGWALIQASMGDKAYVTHLNQVYGSECPGQTNCYYYIDNQAEATPAMSIEMAPGVVPDVNSAMTQGNSAAFRANLQLSAFGELNLQIATGTDQSPVWLLAGVAAAPPFAVNGGFPDTSFIHAQLNPRSFFGSLGTLATVNVSMPSPPRLDMDLGDIDYRNGFPASYKSIVFAEWGLPVELIVPIGGSNYAGQLTGYISMNSVTPPSANRPISPSLGPVTNLSLDLADVFSSPLTGASLTPRITWSPPTLGDASFYQVDLLQFKVGQCLKEVCAVSTNVATFQTQQNSLELPPGVLMPASTYVVVVTAKNATASDLNSAPLRTTYPFAYADTVSQPFTTAGTAPADVVAAARTSYGPLVRSRKNVQKDNFGLTAMKNQ